MHKIWEYDSLPSTNDKARELIQSGQIKEGQALFTTNQTKGRGQRNTQWHVKPGLNLTFSLVYFPVMLKVDQQFVLNQTVTLGIMDSLKTRFPEGDWKIKWPNDIYHGGQKIGGILIENGLGGKTIDHSIVGIGINVNQSEFPRDLPNPTSLSLITGRQWDIKELMHQIMKKIWGWYQKLKLGDYVTIQYAYEGLLFLKDTWYTFHDQEGKPFRGKILGVEKNGLLILEKPSGKRFQFGFKEISF